MCWKERNYGKSGTIGLLKSGEGFGRIGMKKFVECYHVVIKNHVKKFNVRSEFIEFE